MLNFLLRPCSFGLEVLFMVNDFESEMKSFCVSHHHDICDSLLWEDGITRDFFRYLVDINEDLVL